MNFEQWLQMFSSVIGGLGIFLYGMKNMSDGLQAVAGERLRRMIGAVTGNRLMGTAVGTTVTGIIQSSSVTTVMVVSMVNAGLMTLKQAIPVIFGANIGTTVTAWIMAYSLTQYGLPLLGIAVFFFLFSKNDKVRFTAMIIVGLGMVFFGLDLMSKGLSPLKKMPEFEAWFHRFSASGLYDYPGIIKCILTGAIVTAVVQSSSATVGITMALAGTGLINFYTAAGLVLGENIGTTITAFFASLGTTTNAKRSAYAHMLFNTLGVVWLTPLFPFYIQFVLWFLTRVLGCELPDTPVYADNTVSYPYSQKAIAVSHSWFNIVNVLFFLPWVGPYSKFLMWLVPDRKVPDTPRLTHLDVRIFDTGAIDLEQSRKEIQRMAAVCRKAMDTLRDVLQDAHADRKRLDEIFQMENDLDVMQKEIVEFLGHVMIGNVSHEMVDEGRRQVRMADEYESISDYITAILKLRLKMRDSNQHLSQEAKQEVLELHDTAVQFIDLINTIGADGRGDADFLSEAQTRGNSITSFMKECRNRHLARLGDGKATPLNSLIYTDMLTAYRRIKDHVYNIAEVLAGEK
ncbi:MAG TPA: Na/Pi cotransporter family protein [Anaerohalosphaeraceae bacterium]|nr:Na/Pi cotransporter family protein [Anaerohalosphaeraceae bacterium]